MDYNKGRFIPTINPLSIFSKTDARTPFEGELCLDENTNDVSFWRKNPETNLWENVSRTKEIQKYLDAYEADTTFPAARAFVADGLIHRFYYNKLEMSCWLDNSVTNNEYKYFAIKSIKKINGSQRYMTGEYPHDGFDYQKALISVSEKAQLVFEVLPNNWYTIEFYDVNKRYKASINFISYPSKTVPIEINLKETGAKTVDSNLVRYIDTRLIDASVKFNQSLGLNSAYLYLNQSIDDLKVSIIERMADGHTCVVSSENFKLGYIIKNNSDEKKTLHELLLNITPEVECGVFKYWSLDGKTKATLEVLTSIEVPANNAKSIDVYAIMESKNGIEDRIRFKNFDKIDNTVEGVYDCTVLFDYIKTNNASKKYKVDTFVESVVNDNDVIIELNASSETREYNSIFVKQIGESKYESINIGDGDDDCTLISENGIDKITIPRNYFGFGRNSIKIAYTENIENSLVKVNDLTLSIPVKVTVKRDDYFDIDKFIPTGYVYNPYIGRYYIKLKYFAHFENGRIEDITDRVETIQPVNESLFGVTQTVSVRVYVDHIKKNYHDYEFDVFCTDPALSGNNSRVIINGNQTPRILFYNGEKFDLGVFNSSGNQMSVQLSSILDSAVMSFKGHKPTHIRVREVENSTKIYTDIVDSTNNLIYANTVSVPIYFSPTKDITLGEILSGSDTIDKIEPSSFDNYVFQYYSIDGGNHAVSLSDKQIVCKKDTLITFNVDGVKTFLTEVHKKNTSIYSISKDKPFLVEGYYKDETGKYVCTGAVLHYAEQLQS